MVGEWRRKTRRPFLKEGRRLGDFGSWRLSSDFQLYLDLRREESLSIASILIEVPGNERPLKVPGKADEVGRYEEIPKNRPLA